MGRRKATPVRNSQASTSSETGLSIIDDEQAERRGIVLSEGESDSAEGEGAPSSKRAKRKPDDSDAEYVPAASDANWKPLLSESVALAAVQTWPSGECVLAIDSTGQLQISQPSAQDLATQTMHRVYLPELLARPPSLQTAESLFWLCKRKLAALSLQQVRNQLVWMQCLTAALIRS